MHSNPRPCGVIHIWLQNQTSYGQHHSSYHSALPNVLGNTLFGGKIAKYNTDFRLYIE